MMSLQMGLFEPEVPQKIDDESLLFLQWSWAYFIFRYPNESYPIASMKSILNTFKYHSIPKPPLDPYEIHMKSP